MKLKGFSGLSGAGEMVSGMAQFSIYDIGTGIHTLATNPEAQQQMLNGFGNYLNQLRSGNAKVYGETAFNIVSLVVGGAEIKSAVSIAKASEAESVFSKIGVFTKALGKASLENGKSLLTMPGRAVDNIGNKLTDIRELFGGKGLNYAFAHAGEGRSVLNVVGKSADDLPRSGVRNNFSKVVGENASGIEKKAVMPTAIPKEHSDFLYSNGKVPAVTKPYNEFKVRQPEWADENGYVNWNHEEAPKGKDGFLNSEAKDYIPKAAEQSDRFGNSGRYSSPIANNKSYEFSDRALPHEQSSLPYRRFEFTKDLSPDNIREAFNNSSAEVKIKLDVWSMRNNKMSFEDWSKIDENLVTKRGIADEGWKQLGGAIQDMYPMPDDKLSLIGMIKYK